MRAGATSSTQSKWGESLTDGLLMEIKMVMLRNEPAKSGDLGCFAWMLPRGWPDRF